MCIHHHYLLWIFASRIVFCSSFASEISHLSKNMHDQSFDVFFPPLSSLRLWIRWFQLLSFMLEIFLKFLVVLCSPLIFKSKVLRSHSVYGCHLPLDEFHHRSYIEAILGGGSPNVISRSFLGVIDFLQRRIQQQPLWGGWMGGVVQISCQYPWNCVLLGAGGVKPLVDRLSFNSPIFPLVLFFYCSCWFGL